MDLLLTLEPLKLKLGINLQVDLNPKSLRRQLRSQTYEECINSGECDIVENSTSEFQSQLQNVARNELQLTTMAGTRLAVDFDEKGTLIME